MVDAPEDANFPRAAVARRDGLHAAFGFPLLSPRGVVGVMEFFSRELREPDERLLETMRELGSQVGPVRRAASGGGGGARERVAAAGDARGRARRGRDDGSRADASIGWNHAAEATFGYRAARGHRPRDGRSHRSPRSARGAPKRARALPRDRAARHPRQAARADRHAQERDRVPRRAHDHEDRASRRRRPSPATCGTSPTASGRRPSCAHPGHASSRSPTRSGGGSSATSTTARSSGSPRCCSTSAGCASRPSRARRLLDAAIEELAAGLQEIRELASGLHPSLLAERGLAPALEALALRAPVPVELQTSPTGQLPEQVEAAAYYVVAEGLANAHKHAGGSQVVVDATRTKRSSARPGRATTASAEPTSRAAVCAGSPTASRRSAGRLALESPAGGGTRLLARLPVG